MNHCWTTTSIYLFWRVMCMFPCALAGNMWLEWNFRYVQRRFLRVRVQQSLLRPCVVELPILPCVFCASNCAVICESCINIVTILFIDFPLVWDFRTSEVVASFAKFRTVLPHGSHQWNLLFYLVLRFQIRAAPRYARPIAPVNRVAVRSAYCFCLPLIQDAHNSLSVVLLYFNL
jgi:hypothetical protein